MRLVALLLLGWLYALEAGADPQVRQHLHELRTRSALLCASALLHFNPQQQAQDGRALASSYDSLNLLATRAVQLGQPEPLASQLGDMQRLFKALGLGGIGFLGQTAGQLHLALLGPSLPLSHGDGGLCSTARDLAQWLHLQNRDSLGIADLVTAPGELNDGTPVDYGWGLGLRRHRHRPLLIHGGEWPGAAAKAVRSPELDLAVVGMAAGAEFETLNRLVSAGLEDIG